METQPSGDVARGVGEVFEEILFDAFVGKVCVDARKGSVLELEADGFAGMEYEGEFLFGVAGGGDGEILVVNGDGEGGVVDGFERGGFEANAVFSGGFGDELTGGALVVSKNEPHFAVDEEAGWAVTICAGEVSGWDNECFGGWKGFLGFGEDLVGDGGCDLGVGFEERG